MLKRLYEKNEIMFAVIWIIAYCFLLSVGDTLSTLIGLQKSITLCVGILLSAIALTFLKRNTLFDAYGFCPSQVPLRSMLFYIPPLFMLTANLWHGVMLNYSGIETTFYLLSMLCVGFLEELIFRGFLFEAMRKETPRAAIIVSSLTFGIGHIINLINGSGVELIPNLMQVIYATAAGFMFLMIYLKTKSIYGCIIIHAVFNALSVFANESKVTGEMQIISGMLLTLITGGYALYLWYTMKEQIRGK